MAKIVDPVCKVELDERSRDTKLHHEGETYYFCSEACRDAFKKAPEKFLSTKKKKVA
ncbi:MAG: YHS domain-containing protein [Deltaproteobacteria bacterium]|nr:YHS domain-containing protein [Deltaproteobacteria bacterium]MCL5277487.1 YHS domain-containing protein [Deltaproteobacteria bacterium]